MEMHTTPSTELCSMTWVGSIVPLSGVTGCSSSMCSRDACLFEYHDFCGDAMATLLAGVPRDGSSWKHAQDASSMLTFARRQSHLQHVGTYIRLTNERKLPFICLYIPISSLV